MTSIENDNSTDGKDKAGRTIATLSTKELAKPKLGPRKHERLNIDRRNDSVENRKSTGYKVTDPVNDMDKVRDTIVALSTTKESIRKDKKPTRSEDMKDVNADQGRKNSPEIKSEKRTLLTSQMKKTSESLRYSKSEKSTSEDNVIHGRIELSDKRACNVSA